MEDFTVPGLASRHAEGLGDTVEAAPRKNFEIQKKIVERLNVPATPEGTKPVNQMIGVNADSSLLPETRMCGNPSARRLSRVSSQRRDI